MKSSTSPYGRDVKTMGNPLKMTDIVATLPGTYYEPVRVHILLPMSGKLKKR